MFLKIIFQETSSLLNTAKYGVALKNIDQVAENFFLVGGERGVLGVYLTCYQN